ncbi:DMT family transporter [Actinocrispum wychmicini]|uniref:DME family drug/metabolite transporter n=1 Tax=Actinocrispum wychmicini TaxID=1213861 RepID=A0A4R2JYX2_9PSEU|nr:EamA family transporter [Actinocrispum wychmicini]TCO64472.1 DME family drug/metabolite transporter [Actinocrispum wychmicini]
MFFLVLAGVLWGAGGLSGSLLGLQTGLDPLAVAAYRLLIGGAIATLALGTRLKRLPRTAAAIRRLFAAGALLAVFQASYFGAVAMTSVSLATLVTIGSVPVIVAAVTAVRERKAPTRRTALCVALAVSGLAMLAGMPSTRDTWHTVAGVALSLAAGTGFAAFTLVNRRPVAGLSNGVTTGLGLLVGGILLLPAALPLGMAIPLTPQVVLTAVFLGTVPTAIAYGAYFAGLQHVSPVAAALSAMLEPLTATVLSVTFFHDRLGAVGIVGAVLLGVALVVNYSAQSGSADGEPALPAEAPDAEVRS